MSQLTIASVPGFNDLTDPVADDVVTDDTLVKISQNAKFAAVRMETIYMGFYKNGDTIGTPVSPVDGYAYSRAEMLFDFSLYSTRAPGAGFVSGQATVPDISPTQADSLYWFTFDIDDTTGAVSITTSYFRNGGSETVTHDGIVKVSAVCQRSSVNTAS